jgi:hypothetical protein
MPLFRRRFHCRHRYAIAYALIFVASAILPSAISLRLILMPMLRHAIVAIIAVIFRLLIS